MDTKRIKFILIMLVTIVGIGAAYAKRKREPRGTFTTYYAMRTALGWTWITQQPPEDYSCFVSDSNVYCTIIVFTPGVVPDDNNLPPPGTYVTTSSVQAYYDLNF